MVNENQTVETQEPEKAPVAVGKKMGFKYKFKRFLISGFGAHRSDIIFHAINYTLFALFTFVMLYPFIYVLTQSFVSYKVVDGQSVKVISLAGYQRVLSNPKLLWSLFNTAWVMVVKLVTTLLVTFMFAYSLSKKYLKGRSTLMMILLVTMYFSGGMIPTYILITQDLGWRNNYLTYIIPSMIGAYNVFVVKAFLQGIPDSLEEAAYLDGANSFQIFMIIYLPLSGPIIATIALWEGVGLWNNWSTGLYYFTDQDKLLFVSLVRRTLNGMSTSNMGGDNGDASVMAMTDNIKMAIVVISIAPILFVYPFVQKHFVKGMLVGSIKG